MATIPWMYDLDASYVSGASYVSAGTKTTRAEKAELARAKDLLKTWVKPLMPQGIRSAQVEEIEGGCRVVLRFANHSSTDRIFDGTSYPAITGPVALKALPTQKGLSVAYVSRSDDAPHEIGAPTPGTALSMVSIPPELGEKAPTTADSPKSIMLTPSAADEAANSEEKILPFDWLLKWLSARSDDGVPAADDAEASKA